MSRRVSNGRTNQSRKITGRQRVRFGWRERQRAEFLYTLRGQLMAKEAGAVAVVES